MEEEFIPYEHALALKELGFDESCFATFYKKELSQYPNSREEETGFNTTPFEVVKNSEIAGLIADTISAPTYSQAFRWFRENYKSNFIIGFGNDGGYYRIDNLFSKWYKTYEEAELECLKKLIEIVNNFSEKVS